MFCNWKKSLDADTAELMLLYKSYKLKKNSLFHDRYQKHTVVMRNYYNAASCKETRTTLQFTSRLRLDKNFTHVVGNCNEN